MSRFRSFPSDFTVFESISPVCCCLGSFEVPDLEILGIAINYKTLSIICVKPRQRNSGVHRWQILCRIWFHRSGRRNSPQFRGLQWFDDVDRGIFRRRASFSRKTLHRGSRDSIDFRLQSSTQHFNWMKQWNKKSDKRCNLGEAKSLYRAKNLTKGAGRNTGPFNNNIIDILKLPINDISNWMNETVA